MHVMVILKVILILGRFKKNMSLHFSITLLDYHDLGLTIFYTIYKFDTNPTRNYLVRIEEFDLFN
jgi:hypothetical protein